MARPTKSTLTLIVYGLLMLVGFVWIAVRDGIAHALVLLGTIFLIVMLFSVIDKVIRKVGR